MHDGKLLTSVTPSFQILKHQGCTSNCSGLPVWVVQSVNFLFRVAKSFRLKPRTSVRGCEQMHDLLLSTLLEELCAECFVGSPLGVKLISSTFDTVMSQLSKRRVKLLFHEFEVLFAALCPRCLLAAFAVLFFRPRFAGVAPPTSFTSDAWTPSAASFSLAASRKRVTLPDKTCFSKLTDKFRL